VDVPRVPRPEEGSAFWRHLGALLPIEGDAVDVGTGTGRVALFVAPRAREVLGVDVDASSLEAARWDAQRRGVTNVRFHQADAETVDLRALHEGRPFELATARLFLSRSLLPRLVDALAPGGHLVLEALEAENWREAGGSRFNLPVDEVVQSLSSGGMRIEDARVEVERARLADARAAQAHLKDRRLWTKWKADGRWTRLQASLRAGEPSLTEARLVVWARRPNV
jgi:SAM-dependent methyltransferase